jgi:predicted nucleotidyltransferase
VVPSSPTPVSLDARALSRVAEVARRRGVDLVVLFGSVARGRAHARSDVDVAVRLRGGIIGGPALVDLPIELAAALDVPEVDLVDLRTADPLLLRQVFDHAVVLFEDRGAFASARLEAFHRYEDYRPYLRFERDVVRHRLGLP